MEIWQQIGSPGKFGDRKSEILKNYDLFYGKGNWRLITSQNESDNYLEVKGTKVGSKDDLYFVTSNSGKVVSAQHSLGDQVHLHQVELDISEEQDTIEEIADHKARVAYAVLCRPVICDDSGFVISSMNGYPGTRVGRELKNSQMGIEGFKKLARNGPLDAYFVLAVTYFDETLEKPEIYISKVEGQLIGETRGDMTKSFVKSPLAGSFIISGQTKTVAEMSEQEYKMFGTTNRWKELAKYLSQKESNNKP